MTARVLHFDAFSNQPGKGNPAGVVLHAEQLDDDAMLAIAHAVGFNETVYVLPSDRADVRLRYFTPGHEVDLCGHATVAAFVALHQHSLLPGTDFPRHLTLEARAGILPITVDVSAEGDPLITMTQAPAQFVQFGGDRAALASSLGIDANDLHPTLPILYGSTGLWTLVVPVRDVATIRKMVPKNERFPDVLVEMPGASVHPFCLETTDPDAHMYARHFSSPRSGTVEDPVTGTASGVLGAYFREFVNDASIVADPLVVEQGYEVGRNGRVQVWAEKQDGQYAVRIAGTGCYVGELEIAIG